MGELTVLLEMGPQASHGTADEFDVLGATYGATIGDEAPADEGEIGVAAARGAMAGAGVARAGEADIVGAAVAAAVEAGTVRIAVMGCSQRWHVSVTTTKP